MQSKTSWEKSDFDAGGESQLGTQQGPCPSWEGATIRQFFTIFGKDRFEINLAPWAKGQLKVSIEDVGTATAFLAHDAARPITGDTIYIDGGHHVVD
jgi:enoyl-[acyl-carrier-protein] reductase (NADH)